MPRSEDVYGHRCRNSNRPARCSAATRRSSRSCTSAISPIPRACRAEWRGYFDELRGDAADVAHAPVVESFRELARNRRVAGAMVDATTMHKQVLVLRLISKFRTLGMFARRPRSAEAAGARVHPRPRPAHVRLHRQPTSTREFDVGSFKAGPRGCGCATSIAALKETYTRTFGAEYMYISDTRDQALRPGAPRADPLAPELQRRTSGKHILERLTAAETLERYLHTKYVGQKRFSGEGGDTMIPMLDLLIQRAGARGRAGDRDRHGAPRPAQRARQHARARCRATCSPSSKARRRRSCRRATSSTTRDSRRTSRRRAARCT